jgi:hypothetical protein
MVIEFGSGVLFGKPIAGNQPTNPTPVRLGVLQECSVMFKGDLKKLFGQYQFPVATARGKVDIEIKGKFAAFDPVAINQLFFAQVQASGIVLIADNESHAIAATVTATNSATFVSPGGDFGVQNGTTGATMVKVPSAPAVGQYSVVESTGVYSFNATDVTSGFPVLLSYLYNSAARGLTTTIANQLMGYAPEVQMFLYGNFRGKYLACNLLDVTLGEISLPTKLEDFWISDLTGGANANAAGVVGYLYSDAA